MGRNNFPKPKADDRLLADESPEEDAAPAASEVDAFVEKEDPALSGPVNVIAIRDGFYKRQRKAEGAKFTIEHKGQLGSWMKII